MKTTASHERNVNLVRMHSEQKCNPIVNKLKQENEDMVRAVSQIKHTALPIIIRQAAQIEAQQLVINSQAAQIALLCRKGKCKF